MAKKRKGERPDGLIQVALDVGHWPDGRRKRKYFYGHTRAEANAKKLAYKTYVQVGSIDREKITVGEWVTIFKDTYRQGIDEAYLKGDDRPYDRLIEALGDMRMKVVTESDLQAVLNQTKGMSFSTCDKYRQAIKRVFRRAVKNRIIDYDPADDLRMPPHTKGSHRALEAWEVSHILAHWNEPGLHAGLWVMLMLLAGLRRGEMMALDWSAVDLDARVLTVRQTAVIHGNQAEIVQRAKSKAGLRSIPMCEPLFTALSSVPEDHRDGLVCRSAKGLPLTESACSRGLDAFCHALERLLNGEPLHIQGKRPAKKTNPNRKTFAFRAHDLRHTFCTLLYDSGVDVKTAAYLMGHADIRVTMAIYTHLSEQRRKISETKMLGYFNALKTPENPAKTQNGGSDGGKSDFRC